MAKENWRDCILTKIKHRNHAETDKFCDLIALNNKVFKYANALRNENAQLSQQNETLRAGEFGVKAGDSSVRFQEKLQMEQKLLSQQEELTELHRTKGQNAQRIIDLNNKLQELEKLLASKDETISTFTKEQKTMKVEKEMYEKAIKELQYLLDTMRDEHQALQLAFSALEEKLRVTQDENRQLVDRLIHYKKEDVDRLNEENDNFVKKKFFKMQKEIEDACRETRSSTEEVSEAYGVSLQESSLPAKCIAKKDVHDGEVNAVAWSPADGTIATAGADRKVKLWDISKGDLISKGMLVGSNAGVMSVDFDSTGSLILGASNDYASRVWSTTDQRLKHTLTGHSGKVMAARFLGGVNKVVTGSHDRTLKIWELKNGACIETKFAGSSCNDLVTVDSNGSTIISGHFDKNIRIWDTRAEAASKKIPLNGKVTSLDLTKDGKYLLCCVRDDTLQLLDLRQYKIVNSFSCDGFKVGCDWSRATFSPDGHYVSVGSADGSVYIWGVGTNQVEAILKDHGSSVTATAWQLYGSYLATVDRTKRLIIWGDK